MGVVVRFFHLAIQTVHFAATALVLVALELQGAVADAVAIVEHAFELLHDWPALVQG